MREPEFLYRVTFLSQGQVYEVYVKNIYQSDIYGFVEIEHYYRPAGQPRHLQPWLATVWRRPEGGVAT